jgi:hypothetical protein
MALPPLLADIGKDSNCYKKERENINKEVREVAVNSVLADREMGIQFKQKQKSLVYFSYSCSM